MSNKLKAAAEAYVNHMADRYSGKLEVTDENLYPILQEGHQLGENLNKALQEKTGLDLGDPKFIKALENIKLETAGRLGRADDYNQGRG